MKRVVKLLMSGFMLMCMSASAQSGFRKAFDDFTTSATITFSSFTDTVNSIFAESIKSEWTEYKAEKPLERSNIPEPISVPVAADTLLVNRSIPVIDEHIIRSEQWSDDTSSMVLPTSAIDVIRHKYVKFKFFDTEQVIPVPEAYGTFHPTGITEKDVSDFWKRLSEFEYQLILSECDKLRQAYGYNDWAILLWAQALSKALFPLNRHSEQTVFCVFLMNQLGLMTKVARVEKELIVLFSSKQTIYARKFIVVDTYPYYTVGESSSTDVVYTYNNVFSEFTRPMDMRIAVPMQLGSKDSYKMYYKYSESLKRTFTLPVNTQRTAFYSLYPQLDVNMYAKAVPDSCFCESMNDTIKAALSGKDIIESLNILLKFCQTTFDYKSDREQFGYEKPFFLEENFMYDYNDCEDRAILFSYLARTLLDCNVVLLDYPGHVAAAVSFGIDVDGEYVRLDGRKYYVCDPTYVGARIGMLMPEYQGKSVKVWRIE